MDDDERERLKMYQDSFKHMTTFCSGAILLAAAVTGALFLPEPDSKLVHGGMLKFSIILLAIGAAVAMFGLPYVARRMDSAMDGDDVPAPSIGRLRTLLWVCVVAAYFGIAAFAFFATRNLTT